jgi:hypothetical protein
MPPPEAAPEGASADRAEFGRTRRGLQAAAFLAPFSATHLAGPLTVGRVAALAFAALLGADVLSQRWSLRFEPSLATILLVVGYLGLCAWVLLNSAAWGCNCEGKTGGLFELALIGLLAVVAIGLEPRLGGTALLASLAGLTFAAALALAGVGSLNSGTIDLTDTGGRLSGTYGNANELGLAAALGIPVALAYIPLVARAMRLALGGALAVLVLTLILTYSRGGVLAAAVGVLALALWTARGSRRRVALILTAALVVAAAGAGLYSIFENHRESASFGSVSPALAGLDQQDQSGWDMRALGPIPNGPSRLRNGEGGIEVIGGRGGEGASFRWGEAAAGQTYALHFRARALGGPVKIDYALADRLAGGGASRSARLGRSWRSFRLAWRPPRPAPHASLYVWQPRGPARFAISDVGVLLRGPGVQVKAIPVPDRLRGSIYAQMRSAATRLEKRYLESRLDAARLAWRAFRSAPLQGIGWSTFPTYSSERLDYGRLAAHDQYLLIAAELGLFGLCFLALLLAAPVVGLRRVRPDTAVSAAVGLLAAAAAGMVFVEVLSVPQLAIPMALAAAVVCAGPQAGLSRSAGLAAVSRRYSTVRRRPSAKSTAGS